MEILQACELKKTYGMRSLNMREAAEELSGQEG